MTDDKRVRRAYDMLRAILGEQAGTQRSGGRSKKLDVEAAILAVLRKKATEGNRVAFDTLKWYAERCPPAQAAAMKGHESMTVFEFFSRGGVRYFPTEWMAGHRTQEVWDAHMERLHAILKSRLGPLINRKKEPSGDSDV